MGVWFSFERTPWSPERVEDLLRLRNANLSASQIAKELGGGISRSAVISKLVRMGVPLMRATGPRLNHLPKIKKARAKAIRNGGAVIAKIQSAISHKEREIADAASHTWGRSALVARARARGELPSLREGVQHELVVNAKLVPLMELKSHHCRFPIGQVGTPEFGFCGREKAHGFTSYCKGHHRIAWVPARDRGVARQPRNRTVLVSKYKL